MRRRLGRSVALPSLCDLLDETSLPTTNLIGQQSAMTGNTHSSTSMWSRSRHRRSLGQRPVRRSTGLQASGSECGLSRALLWLSQSANQPPSFPVKGRRSYFELCFCILVMCATYFNIKWYRAYDIWYYSLNCSCERINTPSSTPLVCLLKSHLYCIPKTWRTLYTTQNSTVGLAASRLVLAIILRLLPGSCRLRILRKHPTVSLRLPR